MEQTLDIMRNSDPSKDGIHDKSGQSTSAHDENGAGLPFSQHKESDSEDDNGRHIDTQDGCSGRRQEGRLHHGKGSGTDHADDGGTQSAEGVINDVQITVFSVKPGNQHDDDTGRQDTAQGSHDCTGYAGHAGSNEAGGVDGDGAWRHLGDGDKIGEFTDTHPVVLRDDLFLDQRHGGISAAD